MIFNQKKPPQVFELIKSLTKSEKRYFKISAANHTIGEENNYVKLYDLLNKQKKYDESEIVKILKGHKFVSRLSASYYELYNLILKSLNEFHSGLNADFRIKEYLQNAKVLYDKGHYEQALKILRKAKVLAYDHEEYQAILEIIVHEVANLKQLSDPSSMVNELEELNEARINVLEKISSVGQLSLIHEKIENRLQRYGMPRNEKEVDVYKKIMDDPVVNRNISELTEKEKNWLYTIKVKYYYALDEIEKCFEFMMKQVSLLESNTKKFDDSMEYIKALSNLHLVCNMLKKHDEVKLIRESMKKYCAKHDSKFSFPVNVLVFHELNNDLVTCIDMGEYEEGFKLVPEFEEGMKKYGDRLGTTTTVVMYYNMALLYVEGGELRKSLRWLNKLLNETDSGTREDIQCFARILLLIVHYDLENLDVLPYYVRSTYGYLYKRNRVYKMESSILNFIRKKLPKINQLDTNALMEAFAELKDEVEKISEDPFEKKAIDHFDFISWLESKLQNRPFTEVIKEKKRADAASLSQF